MDKRIFIGIAICLIFFGDTAFGQEISWQKMFGTNLQDFFNAICKDSSGNYILGIGFGRKVTSAEQECAKRCLINLQIDLNF